MTLSEVPPSCCTRLPNGISISAILSAAALLRLGHAIGHGAICRYFQPCAWLMKVISECRSLLTVMITVNLFSADRSSHLKAKREGSLESLGVGPTKSEAKMRKLAQNRINLSVATFSACSCVSNACRQPKRPIKNNVANTRSSVFFMSNHHFGNNRGYGCGCTGGPEIGTLLSKLIV